MWNNPINKIVNSTHRDLAFIWDDIDGTLYIFPGPHWLGLEAGDVLDSNDALDLLHEEYIIHGSQPKAEKKEVKHEHN